MMEQTKCGTSSTNFGLSVVQDITNVFVIEEK